MKVKTLRSLVQAAADVTGVDVDEIMGNRQVQPIVTTRHVAWVVIRDLMPEASFSDIGHLFDRDHSTVVSRVARMRQRAVAGTLEAKMIKAVKARATTGELTRVRPPAAHRPMPPSVPVRPEGQRDTEAELGRRHLFRALALRRRGWESQAVADHLGLPVDVVIAAIGEARPA